MEVNHEESFPAVQALCGGNHLFLEPTAVRQRPQPKSVSCFRCQRRTHQFLSEMSVCSLCTLCDCGVEGEPVSPRCVKGMFWKVDVFKFVQDVALCDTKRRKYKARFVGRGLEKPAESLHTVQSVRQEKRRWNTPECPVDDPQADPSGLSMYSAPLGNSVILMVLSGITRLRFA